jgi:hypothetical protein
MNITFPYPATSGQTYTAENGVLYYYDGTKWISQGQGGGGGTGNYGNANVAAYLPTYSGDLGNVGNITANTIEALDIDVSGNIHSSVIIGNSSVGQVVIIANSAVSSDYWEFRTHPSGAPDGSITSALHVPPSDGANISAIHFPGYYGGGYLGWYNVGSWANSLTLISTNTVSITTEAQGGIPGETQWLFDTAGNLTLPALTGTVQTISLTYGGVGYTTANDVPTDSGPYGNGHGMTLNIVADTSNSNAVLNATISNPGQGYHNGAVITIAQPSSTGTATVTVVTVANGVPSINYANGLPYGGSGGTGTPYANTVGSFGSDMGIGPNYAINNPAVLFSDDDMVIRTGGTANAGGTNYGQMDIAASEALNIGLAANLADATYVSSYSSYISFPNSNTINAIAGSNYLTIDATTGLTYNGNAVSTVSLGSFEFLDPSSNTSIMTVSDNSDIVIRPSDPSYQTYINVPGNINGVGLGEPIEIYNGYSNSNPGSAVVAIGPDALHGLVIFGDGTGSFTGNVVAGNISLGGNINANANLAINVNSNDWIFATDSTLYTPLLLPKIFTATLVPVYGFNPGYNPPGPTGGSAWYYEVHFVVSQDGTVETQINNPVWYSNPGYNSGDSWNFTEADHGIPGYTFTLTLNNITYPGPAGWTADVAASPPPDYPSTLKSSGAVKLSADNKNWILGTGGNLILPQGGYIGAAGVKGDGTMLTGGTGNIASLTSFYADAPGIYSSCVTAYPDGNLNITTYGNGTGQLGQWIFSGTDLLAPGNLSLNGGEITGGVTTTLDDTIYSLTLGTTTVLNINGVPFTSAARGQVTISGITSTTQANGTWYYQAVGISNLKLYTDGTYTTPVDSTTWTPYTSGDGSVHFSQVLPSTNIVINSNGYISTFNNDGQLELPGDVSASGTITANYFNGDGSNLSNVNTNLITNGTSYANISSANANLTVNINSNEWTFGDDGSLSFPTAPSVTGAAIAYVAPDRIAFGTSTGNMSIFPPGQEWIFDETGNITMPTGAKLGPAYSQGGTYLVNPAAGTSTSDFVGLISNDENVGIFVNDTGVYIDTGNNGSNPQWEFKTDGSTLFPGNLSIAGNVSVSGNITGNGLYIAGNSTMLGSLNVQGNVTFINSNVITTNDLYVELANNQSTYANINGAGLNVGPAGSPLTNWTYNSTANVWTTNVGISATGNIRGDYILGNGSQLTGLPAGYANSNAASFLAAFGSNVISTTGTITSGNITGSNILTGGIVSAAGNIRGNYILGDGGLLSNIIVSGSSPVSTTGNVTGGNLVTAGNVSATGNITANYFIGNGSQLTGLPAGYANSNAASFLAAFGSNTISTTGAITSGNINGSNLLTGGAVSATGSVNTLSLSTRNGDANPNNSRPQVSFGYNGTNDYPQFIHTRHNGGSANYNTIELWTSDGTQAGTFPGNAVLGLTVSNAHVGVGNIVNPGNTLDVGGNVYATGNVSANYFIGNGSQLTGLAVSSGEASFSIQVSNFSATTGNRYGVNTLGGVVTATLPASPITGGAIYFADAGGAFATNNLIIDPNGGTIMNSTGNMTVSTNNQSFGLFYNGTTWRTYI